MENRDLKEKPAIAEGGFDHTNYQHSTPSFPVNQADCEEEFRSAMSQAGIDQPPSKIIADGKFHSFPSTHKGKHNQDCRYIFHGTHGYFCDWSKGIEGEWSILHNPKSKLSPSERGIIQKDIEKTELYVRDYKARIHNEVAQKAQEKWAKLAETGHSKYLERKQVEAFGIRFGQNYIAIPLRDIDGKIYNLQKIFDKKRDGLDTDKVFMKEGCKNGCFHVLGTLRDGETFYVCEGYATAASIHMATGGIVVVAFDCYNLEPVVVALRQKYLVNRIIVCADDDQWKPSIGNIGRKTADMVGKKYGCMVVYPTFRSVDTKPTDFNDLHCLEGLQTVKNQLEFSALVDEWPEPLQIKKELLNVEPLTLEIIPESLQPWLQDVSHRMQCPLEHVAIPAMVMLGGVIGSRCGIRPKKNDSWTIIPNLWGGIIGKPSTLKSPALTEALKPLVRLEERARKKFEAAQADYKLSTEAFKISKEAQASQIKKNIKAGKENILSMENIKSQLSTLVESEEPICERFKTNDATIEKMTELLQESPRGLLLFRDELMGLLSTWDKEGRESDRAFYLEAWNGYGSHTTDRIGRGTTHCKNMCVSILGGTQPDKILSYLKQAINGLGNDGLVQRFQLLVYPDENKGWQLVDSVPNKGAQELVFQVVERIAYMDFSQHGSLKDNADEIDHFHFSPEAQGLFYEWLTDLEQNKLRGDEETIFVEHLAKYRKLMPALALIIHVVDMAEGKSIGPVSLQAAEKAAAWCDFLELHAKRIYGMIINSATQSALSLSKKLKKKELSDGFTIRDVYRKNWAFLTTKEEAESACEILADAGWLKEKYTPPSFGQKSKVEYFINPKIWEV
jgi:putative DNA primase/helicase